MGHNKTLWIFKHCAFVSEQDITLHSTNSKNMHNL